MTVEEQFEGLAGPLYRYSEHKKGERITYRIAAGGTRSGVILWIVGPEQNTGVGI